MSKIAEIDNCAGCTWWEIIKGFHRCDYPTNPASYKIAVDSTFIPSIPDDCPLPDKEDYLRENSL